MTSVESAALELADMPVTARCETITDFARLEEISPAWDQLWRSRQDASIFLSPGWIRAWWKAFGAQASLCTLAVWQGDRLLGALPAIREGGILRFLGQPMSDYMDVLCREESASDVLPVLIETVRSQAPEGGCILQNISENSVLVRGLGSCVPDWSRDMQLLPCSAYPTIELGNRAGKVLDELAHKACLRRPTNKFVKAGRATFRHVESKQEAACHVQRFFAEHTQRHALLGQKSSLLTSQVREFFCNLVDELDLSRELRFAVLELNGEAVAHSLGFEVAHRFLMYQQAFQVDYWNYSPGDVLLRHLFQWANKAGIQSYDFGRGQESYKARFANGETRTFTLHVEPFKHWAGLRRFSRSLECHARHAVKRRPLLLRLARKLRRGPLPPEKPEGQQPDAQATRSALFNRLWEQFTGPGHIYYGCPRASASRRRGSAVTSQGAVKHKLSDLADFVLEHEGTLRGAELREFRTRLRHGERFYMESRDSGDVQLAWLRQLPENESPAPAAGEAASVLVYDFRSFPHGSTTRLDMVPHCLEAIFEQNPASNLWVSCNRHDKGLQHALELAGCVRAQPPRALQSANAER